MTTDGKYLVSGKKEASMVTGHAGAVLALALTSDGFYLVSASEDKTIKIWSFEEKTQICTIAGNTDAINSLTF